MMAIGALAVFRGKPVDGCAIVSEPAMLDEQSVGNVLSPLASISLFSPNLCLTVSSRRAAIQAVLDVFRCFTATRHRLSRLQSVSS